MILRLISKLFYAVTLVHSLPIAVLHGFDSSSKQMEPLCDWLSATFKQPVINLEIGEGVKTSIFMPMNDQLDKLCEIIYEKTELQNGFNFIGMSQGGLLARGYVERCNKYPVINLITLVSPHGGEFLKSINIDAYTDFYQEHLSPAGYWRNPNNLVTYLLKCRYLPKLNNEIIHENADAQKDNIKKLNNFVMVWSPNDTVLYPSESAEFSFYNEDLSIISIRNTELYKNDLLGLKYLDENNRLHINHTNCTHVDHRNPICFPQLYEIFKLFL